MKKITVKHKITALALFMFVLLYLGFQIFINNRIHSYLYNIIDGNIALKSQLTVSEIHFNLWDKSIEFRKLSLQPNAELLPREQNLLIGVDFDHITCNNIGITDFIFDNKIDVENIKIKGAKFKIVKIDSQLEHISNINTLLKDFTFQIENLHLQNASLLLYDFAQKGVTQSIENIQLHFENLQNNSDSTAELPLYSNFRISGNNYLLAPDSLHLIQLDNFTITPDTLTLKKLSYSPKHDKYRYTKISGGSTQYNEIKVESIVCLNPNIELLLRNQQIKAPKVELNGIQYNLFRDFRTNTFLHSDKTPFEDYILERFGNFDEMKITNSNFSYEILYPDNRLPAKIKLSEISINSNFSDANKFLQADISGILENNIPVRVKLTIDANKNNKHYQITGEANQFELINLNHAWSLFSQNKFTNGTCTHIQVNLTGSNRNLTFHSNFKYKNLSILPGAYIDLPVFKNTKKQLPQLKLTVSGIENVNSENSQNEIFTLSSDDYYEEILLWPQVLVSTMQKTIGKGK